MAKNQIVLVTGCSSGIGKDLVIALLNRGYTVIAGLRNLNSRKEIFKNQTEEFSDQLYLIELDVCKKEDLESCATFIMEKFSGKLHCLINNAGFGVFGALEDLAEVEIRHQIETNFFGLLLLSKRLLPYLRAAQGKIINISSVLGYSSLPLASMYCASKFAVEGLSEALYLELKPFNVHVSLVEPGGHKTNFKNNMLLGKNSLNNQSPYFNYTNNYCKMLEKKINSEGTPASNVTNTILKILKAKKPLLRYPCGTDAVGVYYLKKLLPQALFLKLVNIITNRLYYHP